MTEIDIVYNLFKEGYENKNFDFIMEHVQEEYIDHSPAGARSNADAVNILKIIEEQFSDLKIEVLAWEQLQLGNALFFFITWDNTNMLLIYD